MLLVQEAHFEHHCLRTATVTCRQHTSASCAALNSDWVGLGWSLGFCIYKKLPSAAAAAAAASPTTLWQARLRGVLDPLFINSPSQPRCWKVSRGKQSWGGQCRTHVQKSVSERRWQWSASVASGDDTEGSAILGMVGTCTPCAHTRQKAKKKLKEFYIFFQASK